MEHYGDYGKDKKRIEERLKESKLNYKIVRPSYIVGKGNHRPRLGHYMNKIIHREHIEVAGDGKNVVNVVFVEDVVNQLVRLATTQARTYEMIEVVGDNIEVIDLIYKVFKYVLDDAYQGNVMLVQDDEKAILPKNDFTFETNWDYTKLEEGLKDYAKWYYNEGAKNMDTLYRAKPYIPEVTHKWILRKFETILQTGALIQGQHVGEFEKEACHMFDVGMR